MSVDSPSVPQKANLERRYLFICRSLNTGGIETHILNTLNLWANSSIHSSALHLCCAGGSLLSDLNPKVQVSSLQAFFPSSSNITIISNILALSNQWTVLSFDPLSRAVAELAVQEVLYSRRSINIKHVSGAFHPRAYFHETDNRVTHIFNQLLHLISKSSVLYFMNQECLNTHQSFLMLANRQPKILHIPVSTSQYKWKPQPYSSSRLRIVSVGRLVRFKAYSASLARLIPALLNKGLDVELDIYGRGPLQKDICEIIQQYNLHKYVHLKDELPYKYFHKILHEYDLFVGMGMAALEAASIGIPTLLAIDSQPDKCYGFVYSAPLGCVGEVSSEAKLEQLNTYILNYASMTLLERNRCSQLCKEHTLPLSHEKYIYELNQILSSCPVSAYSFKRHLLLRLLMYTRYSKRISKPLPQILFSL